MRTNLLVLDAQDLRALMQRDPRVAQRIKDMVSKRVGREVISPKGDIVSEEIEVTSEGDSRAPDAAQHEALSAFTRAFDALLRSGAPLNRGRSKY